MEKPILWSTGTTPSLLLVCEDTLVGVGVSWVGHVYPVKSWFHLLVQNMGRGSPPFLIQADTHHEGVVGELVPVEQVLQEVGTLVAGIPPGHGRAHRAHLWGHTDTEWWHLHKDLPERGVLPLL